MPQIYLTINKFRQLNDLLPYQYIGSDQNDNNEYFGSSELLKEDIGYYGVDNFEKITLEYFREIDNKDLRKVEEKYLKTYNVKKDPIFYNKSDFYAPGGGVKGMKHKKKKVVTEKWRESRRGWQPSRETREFWSQQRQGCKASEDTKQKMSENNARFYAGKSGSAHPVTGYKHSEYEKQQRAERTKQRMSNPEEKRKIAEKMSRDWEIETPNGNIIQVRNLSQWCKDNGVKYSTVTRQHKGWKCRQIL